MTFVEVKNVMSCVLICNKIDFDLQVVVALITSAVVVVLTTSAVVVALITTAVVTLTANAVVDGNYLFMQLPDSHKTVLH